MGLGIPRTFLGSSLTSTHATTGNDAYLPRTQSSPAIVNMRAPFLSPASRPTSSVWSPPSNVYPYPPGQSDSSFSALPRKMKPPMPSSRLSHKLSKEDKPWLGQRDWRDRASWWVTFAMVLLGAGAAGVLCFFGWNSVQMLKDEDLCMVFNENFDTLDLQNTWTRDVELGGFGNGEFQMTTASDANLFVQGGQLYILPTLTSDVIGKDAIFDGGSYSLDGCTTDNEVRYLFFRLVLSLQLKQLLTPASSMHYGIHPRHLDCVLCQVEQRRRLHDPTSSIRADQHDKFSCYRVWEG